MDLSLHGLSNPGPVHAHLSPAQWVELALRRNEGQLASNGAFAAVTGRHTGRAAKDKYVVRWPSYQDKIAWGDVNHPMEPDVFTRLLERVQGYFQRRELFVLDGFACADPHHRVAVRLVTETAWHAMFAQCLLIQPQPHELTGFHPDLVIFHAPHFVADPQRDGVQRDTAVILDLDKKCVLITGTHYAGEVKKSVFTYLNYILPKRGVFPMHCSATVGPAGDSALLFGLSGTGKTTLSADPDRKLVGDDEHGWSDAGVFNFEGGCYAKCIGLTRDKEPQIWDALRFGAILENVVLEEGSRRPLYDDKRLTENTRAAYPLNAIANIEPTGRAGHPRHLFFLTCDAFGVLPPISKLSPAQAQYHFLSGYTSKIAGTEVGIRDPLPTFSTCFGAPFLPRPATVYAEMLQARMQAHDAQVWLVNTGWAGGGLGVGARMALPITRQLLRAAQAGLLDTVEFTPDPVFGVLVPQSCPGVPSHLLQPRNAWKEAGAYEDKAKHLAKRFRDNFAQFAASASPDVLAAGPRGG